MWQVPDSLPIKAACFQNSRPTIEMVRVLLPTFHMRAMSRVIFHKFGQITSDVKPLALKYFYKEITGTVISCTLSLLFTCTNFSIFEIPGIWRY